MNTSPQTALVRTQIYLTAAEQQALKTLAKSLRATRSELIRRAIDRFLVNPASGDPREWHERLERTRGLWRGRRDISARRLRASWDR